MVGRKRSFGELELLVLSQVRKSPGSSVKEVLAGIDTTHSYTTVMTVMNRLVEKGELHREKEGRRYLYTVPVGVSSQAKATVSRLIGKLFGGSSSILVSHLLESSEVVSDDELEEMSRLIEEEKSRRRKK